MSGGFPVPAAHVRSERQGGLTDSRAVSMQRAYWYSVDSRSELELPHRGTLHSLVQSVQGASSVESRPATKVVTNT